ncbi:venom allergen 5-like [Scaptodrosophila lebanonensis]|uniref:Venom allergen 5-like n=1 Tax=Drosophila lebanonensis TaxID=7225 RepID=A0A6J2T4F1_DROLE|nr:venom allergen 5-like [Scaptodrosophila lebanonensis]
MERLVTIFLLVLGGCAASNYHCRQEADLCDEEEYHIACYIHGFDTQICGDDAVLLKLSPSTRDLIVREHNVYRNTVASGKLRGLPKSGYMIAFSWDTELATIAELKAKTCTLKRPDYEFCLATNRFSMPGYNAAFNIFNGEQDELKIIRAQIRSWYNRYRYTTVRSLATGEGSGGKDISHFLQLIFGYSNAIGCAIVRFSTKRKTVQMMYCVYGCNRFGCGFTYILGRRAADGCRTGIDYEFKFLCSKAEFVENCEYNEYCEVPYLYEDYMSSNHDVDLSQDPIPIPSKRRKRPQQQQEAMYSEDSDDWESLLE